MKITAKNLSELTGLSDRRHRQLADAGYFPPPTGGQYQHLPTIEGLLRYFRERLSKRAATYSTEREAYMRSRRVKSELETDLLRGKFMLRAEVLSAVDLLAKERRASLQRKLETELPPRLAGLDAITIATIMRQTVDDVMCEWSNRASGYGITRQTL